MEMLNVNHHLIPVNKARCPVNGYSRDGMMRTDGNYGKRISYEPNSYDCWQEHPEKRTPVTPVTGDGDSYDFRADDNDYYTQPGKRFRNMTREEKSRLFANTARSMQGVPEFIQQRHIENCMKADPEYGRGVAMALQMESGK